MSEYQLEIKQIVDYPRCRIYRQFIQLLLKEKISVLAKHRDCSIILFFVVTQISEHHISGLRVSVTRSVRVNGFAGSAN